jgi:hydrophobic/amphiphilic exporter-1 (mainly G- bacteria), HAE1 family
MHRLIGLCVRRPVGTIMICLGLIVIGLIAASGLGVEFLPDVRLPRLIVSTAFPGLPAAEVRILVSIPLEDALSSLKGIKHISSVSREGASTLALEYHWGNDMQMAAVECRELIDVAYLALPSECRKPLVLPVDPSEEPVLLIGVFPRMGELAFARRIAEREIRTRLQQVNGVGSITLVGGAREEVKVLVDQERVASHGARLDDISDALADANFDYPAGMIVEGQAEFLVKAEGAVREVSKLGDFHVAGSTGTSFRIRDVAEIRRAEKDRLSVFQLNGREGVGLQVRKRHGTSPLSLSAGVREELSDLSRSYGRDLDIVVARDSSRFIAGSLRDLVVSAAVGAAIAFVVVLLFIRDVASSLILISSVPISVIISLLFLRLAGRTVNVMSIGGLSMGIGMMMDNSVVILENLQRRLVQERRGVNGDEVARAVDEMSASNIGNTLTAVVVFLPVIFLPGVIGSLFTDLSLSVIFSQITSFLVSITLVPVLFLLTERRRVATAHEAPRWTRAAERRFRSLLRLSMRRPVLLAAILCVGAAAGGYGFFRLPFEFMPPVDTGELDVTIALQHGTSMTSISRVGAFAASLLERVPGVESVSARAGGEEDDAYYLADPKERREILHMKVMLSPGKRRTSFAIAAELRKVLVVEGASVSVEAPENVVAPLLGMKAGTGSVKVLGADQEEAAARGAELAKVLERSGLFSSVALYPSGEKPEIRLLPDRDSLARTGTDLSTVARTLRGAIEGAVPTRILVDGKELDVRVLLRPADSSTLREVKQIIVAGPRGEALRVENLVTAANVNGPSALVRADRSDVTYVAAVPARGASSRAEGLVRRLQAERQYAESQDSSVLRENLVPIAATLALVVVLLYLVLGAQFESFTLPLLLLVSLPLSLLGISAALFVTGKSLNLDSLLGIIVLFGISVNNSMVLYENYTERTSRMSRGPILPAIYRGTSERLRPIMITMLTTVMALVPIAVDTSGTSTQSSMAVAVIGGLLVSTAFTLFLVPRLFLRFLRRRHGWA